MEQDKQSREGRGWALIKPTLTAEEYMPVEVVRTGKRFTFVRTLGGDEWRVSTRGLWDGLPSYEAAQAEIAQMRAYRNSRWAALKQAEVGGHE